MEVRRLSSDELQHHGVKGMKWGIRRYQNADGTLTDAGRKKYYKKDGETLTRKGEKQYYSQHMENKLKKAKTKDQKTYIIRSEARKNAQAVTRPVAKGMATGIGLAMGGGALAGITLATGNIPAAVVIAEAAATACNAAILGTVGYTAGKAYIENKKNMQLADLADKYGIEDIKTRNQSNK